MPMTPEVREALADLKNYALALDEPECFISRPRLLRRIATLEAALAGTWRPIAGLEPNKCVLLGRRNRFAPHDVDLLTGCSFSDGYNCMSLGSLNDPNSWPWAEPPTHYQDVLVDVPPPPDAEGGA